MIGFLGCNKEDDNKTKLELNILDQHGNPAKDFNVNLFGNVDDFRMDKPVLQSGKTNQNGVVTFSNLHNIKYYFRATKGCENNNLGAITTVDPIVTDFTTVVTLQVQETCHFTISNNSSDNYQVYYNGVSKYVIPGHSFKTFLNGFPTGTTKVRALQLDGFILFPTDLTFTIDAECNSSEGVVIP
jgi:5-hydroxyisourate hydrolase-like protein (transthyretin family)